MGDTSKTPNFWELGSMDDDEVVGLFLPSNVRDTLNEVKAAADRLDGIVRFKQPPMRAEVKQAWDAWYKAWSEFYTSIVDSWISVVKLSLNETYDQAQEYKRKVDSWRTAIEKETGQKLPGPRVGEPETGGVNWTVLAYVGAAVAGAVAVGYVVKAFKE